MTTLVPLTTVFTPAESCSSLLYTFSTEYFGLSWFKQDVLGPGNGKNSACYPPSLSVPGVIYSPGVCPSGYLSVSQQNNRNPDGPTTATCCPSYFTSGLRRGCESTILTPTSTTLVVNATETIITVTTFVAAAFPITVAWASSDLNLFSPKSAPLGLHSASSTQTKHQTTSNTQTTSSAQSTSITKPSSTGTGSSLSTGEVVGISVCATIVFLVALAVGVWLFFRRKKQPRNMARGKQSYPEVYTSPPHVTDNKHGVSQVDTAPAYNVQEMEGSPTQHG